MNNKRAGAPPTIVDVARKAGVSIKTVSRVMNHEPTVRAATRALVLEVVAELNYRPQLSARSLAGARSFLIGLLHSEANAVYAGGLQRGATLRCRETGRHLVVESPRMVDVSATRHVDADAARQVDAMIAALRPDGMILAPPLSDDPTLIASLRMSGTPGVLISPSDHGQGMACVEMDDEQAAFELTESLLELGHTRIAFIQGHQSASDRRQRGFERALRQRGLAVDPALVLPGFFDFDSGMTGAQRLLDLDVPPTAVFAANDEMALGVLVAAQRRGLPVPQSLSIVGFDDTRAASLVWPALTTVRQPLAAMAMVAVDLLLSGDAKSGEMAKPPVRVLAHELVVRGSTAPPGR